MSKTIKPFPEPRLEVTRLANHTVDIHGPSALSVYAEVHWQPILGPSTMAALRLFNRRLRDTPNGFEIETAELAALLGLGTTATGRHGPTWRSLERLVRFRVASRDRHRLSVRCHLPPLGPKQIERLPQSLQHSVHEFWPAPASV